MDWGICRRNRWAVHWGGERHAFSGADATRNGGDNIEVNYGADSHMAVEAVTLAGRIVCIFGD